jgi:N-acetylmuramoyl-L-alanine amidase
MRVKGATIQNFLLGLALLLGVLWNLAYAGEIKDLRVAAGATGTRAEIRLDQVAEYQVISLANPDRLVVDLPGSTLGRNVTLPQGSGLVKAVRKGQPVPGTTRIVFDLAGSVVPLKPRIEQGSDGPRLVLEWPGDGAAASTAPAVATVPPKPAIDPAVASSQATSRLIANLPTPATATTSPRTPSATPATVPGSAPATDAMLKAGSGTVATGVPTRIATGVPTQTPSAAAPPAAAPSTQAPVRTMQDVQRRAGLRPLVIAIDAGHGGQDPGARGATGAREKDLTLQIAKELARQVNATPGLKAYLTRDADFFIPLAQRYQKARAQKADLFVSIHADAFTNPSASGSSVFVLSQRGASSQAAKWLAGQENAADLVGGVRLQDKDNTLASVLLDLSQSATMKASEDMASHVLAGLKRLGKTHKPHVERANFVVLRSPDVPSMLVETAFITNPDEERRLRDPAHQRRLATAILDGVNTYFTRQPPPGTLYAARAEAGNNASSGGSP